MKNKFGWEIKRLGDLISVKTGKLDANAADVDGIYPFFTCSQTPLKINKYRFDGECVLIAGNGDLNVKYYQGKFNAYQRTYVISTNYNDILSVKFLYIFFSKHIDRLRQQSIGGVIKYIKLGNLTDIKLAIPPLPTQHQIVSELDTLSDIINKKKHQLEDLDKLAQATFYDMFGDPVTNEKGWEVKKMKDLTTRINSGNTPNGGSNVYVQEGITFFRSQNVWKNNLVYEDIAFIDIKTHTSMSKSSLKHKDILMTKTGRFNTENSSLGRAALFLGEDDSANINGHVYLIRLKKNQVHGYILHILTCNAFREVIRNVCVGGIDKRQLNKNHIEEFSIIYPSIEHQQTFADILESINKQKSLINQSIVEVQQLFDYTMDKYFN